MSDETKLLEAAFEDFKLSEAGYSEQRAREVEDQRFEAGEHWTAADLEWRRKKKKPAFTMDQLSGQVAKVTNAPVHRILVSANGGGFDPKSAQYWQGVARRIETLSGAEDVYKYARRHAAVMGRGFWRVRADYFDPIELREDGQYDPSIFNGLDLRIEPIVNQHSVHPDPRCRTLDNSDMRFCLITEDVHWSEFERLHPKATVKAYKAGGANQLIAAGADRLPEWASEKTIRVAERYYIEDVRMTLCYLKSGRVVVKAPGVKYAPAEIVREHTFTIPKVRWMKFTAYELLERADVPGRYIPVVMINGERRLIEGQTDCRGMVRMAKDPQRMVDFMESRLAEQVDIASFMTVMAEAESIEAYPEWESLNTERPAVARWNAKRGINGEPLPKPEILQGHPDVAGIALAAQRASMSLRHVLGVPDVTPDELRPEQSGRAITARQREQEQSTSHYTDATAGGIRHTGRIIMSMAREIYDVPRVLRIVGAEEKPVEIVAYRGEQHKGAAEQMAAAPGPEAGQQGAQMRHMLDVSIGSYDVSVAAGRGHDTMRQEAVESVTAMVQAFPPMAPKAIPVILKNSDFPGAQELAAAMEPEQGAGTVPIEQAQQAQQVIDALTQKVNELADALKDKSADRESKERIEAAKLATEKEVESARLALERMKLELERFKVQAELERAKIEAKRAEFDAAHSYAHGRAESEQAAARDAMHGNGAGA